MHQFNRRLIKANGRVIDRGTADLEQLTLAVKFKSVFSLRIIQRRSDGLVALDLVTANHCPPRAGRSWREAL